MTFREATVGESCRTTVFVFVASEPRGRKRKQVEPLRDCCVKA